MANSKNCNANKHSSSAHAVNIAFYNNFLMTQNICVYLIYVVYNFYCTHHGKCCWVRFDVCVCACHALWRWIYIVNVNIKIRRVGFYRSLSLSPHLFRCSFSICVYFYLSIVKLKRDIPKSISTSSSSEKWWVAAAAVCNIQTIQQFCGCIQSIYGAQ